MANPDKVLIDAAQKDQYLNSLSQASSFAKTITDLKISFSDAKNKSVGFSSIELEKDAKNGQIALKNSDIPLPAMAKELHVIAGGLKDLLPEFIYKAATECSLDRIALYNFTLSDFKAVLDYMGHHPRYINPTFDFMTSVSNDDLSGDCSLTELFQELNTWNKRPDSGYLVQPSIKACFTADEINGPNLTEVIKDGRTLPVFIDLHVRNEQTANALEKNLNGKSVFVLK